jgi:hypothetical protein
MHKQSWHNAGTRYISQAGKHSYSWSNEATDRQTNGSIAGHRTVLETPHLSRCNGPRRLAPAQTDMISCQSINPQTQPTLCPKGPGESV